MHDPFVLSLFVDKVGVFLPQIHARLRPYVFSIHFRGFRQHICHTSSFRAPMRVVKLIFNSAPAMCFVTLRI